MPNDWPIMMQAPIVTIDGFSSLIQFVAGIYLVFMYDKIFKTNPLYSQLESLKRFLKGLVNDYQLYMTKEHYDKVSTFQIKRDAKWERHFISLKKMSFISFLFCLLVLFYVGLEPLFLKNNWEQSLIMPSITVLIYQIIIFYFPKESRAIISNRFVGLMFLFLVIYIISFCLLDGVVDILPMWNKTIVYALVLITALFGLVVYAANLCFQCAKGVYVKYLMNKLYKRLDRYLMIKLKVKKLESLTRKEQNRIVQKALESDGNIYNALEELTKDEFRSLFERIVKT